MPFRDFIRTDFSHDERWEPALFMQPQYGYLFNERGEQLVDFIGHFESLQTDFDQICKALDIQTTILPHINRTGQGQRGMLKLKKLIKRLSPVHKVYDRYPHYTGYYGSEDREYVAKMYEQDVERFGYRYGE